MGCNLQTRAAVSAVLIVRAQAREEMEYAGESKETTYFDEEAAAAKEAVEGKMTIFVVRVCFE